MAGGDVARHVGFAAIATQLTLHTLGPMLPTLGQRGLVNLMQFAAPPLTCVGKGVDSVEGGEGPSQNKARRKFENVQVTRP